MNSKATRSKILHGSIARRVVLRTFFLVSGISLIPLLLILHDNDSGMLSSVASCECDPILGLSQSSGSSSFKGLALFPFMDSFTSVQCEEHVNLTVIMAKELIGKNLLNYTHKALCVGEGSFSAASAMRELGILNAVGVDGHRFFSLRQKQFVYELDFKDDSLDFVFFRNLDRLSSPALLVIEIERILRPGGVGAVIVGMSSSKPNSLIRSASPVSSVLKSSNVVHVGYVNNYTLVVFEKKSKKFGFFEQYPMPDQCPSISTNRPFVPQMEPLVKIKPVEFEKRVSTLPKFIDVSSRKRPVYIDIGMGKSFNSNALNEILHFYPLDANAFNIYFVDHNTSIMLSYIRKPGITFVYHPDLAGNRVKADDSSEGDDIDPSLEDEEGFNFLEWFKETVEYADFVVLRMNAKEMELKFLFELFESGVICLVDELFLGCSDGVEEEGGLRGNCMDLLQSLRKSGVFVHQWWDDDTCSSCETIQRSKTSEYDEITEFLLRWFFRSNHQNRG